MRLPPLVRLTRPALAPTAAADVLAAAAFAGGAAAGPLAAAVASSVCLYAGGMAQNDLCDRQVDAKIEPARPLVVDPGLLNPARLLVLGLFGAGIALAVFAGTLWPALAIVVLASTYNLGVKRYFPFDALTMGGARAANLCVGLTVAAAHVNTSTLLYVACYGLFIAGVSAASRGEDLEPPPTRKLALLLAYVPKLAAYVGLGTLAATGERVIIFTIPCVLQAAALIVAMRAGTREAAKRYILRSLQLIFVVHACVLWATKNGSGLIAILVCAAVSFFLLALTAKRVES